MKMAITGLVILIVGGIIMIVGVIIYEVNNAYNKGSITIIKEIKSASGVVINTNGNQTIYLPESDVELEGEAMSGQGTIVAYMWVKISGPAGGLIYNPIGKKTRFGGLTNVGTYVIKFRATDQYGNEGESTVLITVKTPLNNDELLKQIHQ